VLAHASNTVRDFCSNLALPARGHRSDRLDALVPEIDPAARDRVPGRAPANISQKLIQLPCDEFFSEMADLPLWLAIQNVGLPHSKQLQYHHVATSKNDYGGRFRCSQEQQTLEN